MIHIKSGTTCASISPQGAEIMAWSVDGRPLLWEAKPDVWPETAPLLFPVVGWTRDGEVRVDGQTYPLALHGFARYRAFRIAEQEADRVQFELKSDAATRALYPFDFRFAVEYAAGDGSLSTTVTVTNTGDRLDCAVPTRSPSRVPGVTAIACASAMWRPGVWFTGVAKSCTSEPPRQTFMDCIP